MNLSTACNNNSISTIESYDLYILTQAIKTLKKTDSNINLKPSTDDTQTVSLKQLEHRFGIKYDINDIFIE
nr:MAG TPA: hypothetical protein [Caudoviricetes sp.]